MHVTSQRLGLSSPDFVLLQEDKAVTGTAGMKAWPYTSRIAFKNLNFKKVHFLINWIKSTFAFNHSDEKTQRNRMKQFFLNKVLTSNVFFFFKIKKIFNFNNLPMYGRLKAAFHCTQVQCIDGFCCTSLKGSIKVIVNAQLFLKLK